MKKVPAFLFVLIALCTLFFTIPPVFSQEAEEFVPPVAEAPEDTNEIDAEEAPADDYEGILTSSLSSLGDQNFSLTAGAAIPLFYTGQNGRVKTNITVGGLLSLSYNFFLPLNFFVGAEAGGMFAGTLGKNMIYIVPFGVRAGYQLNLGRFEFPISFMIGGAVQRYLETDYLGLFMKPSLSAFFRATDTWSFGLNASWWIVPQWVKESRKNMTGHFLEVSLSARFHF